MVHLVVRASEVVGDHHKLLGRLAVRCLLLLGRWTGRLLPVILHLLDETGEESILHSAFFSEADLLWWDELAGCSEVCQPSSDHAFSELGDVGRQGDRAVAGDLLQILARLGNGDDDSASPLLRDDSSPPRGIQQVQERLPSARAQVLQELVAGPGDFWSCAWEIWRTSSSAVNGEQYPLLSPW